MRAWALVLVFAASAGAEQWADEPAVTAPVDAPPPRFGFLAGAHVSLPPNLTHQPMLGGRVGLRLALARHASVAFLADWGVAPIEVLDGKGTIETIHLVSGLALFELFTHSAFEHVLVPELSVGAIVGVGAALSSASSTPFFAGEAGLHFGFTRLRPSGWWFPFFLEVILNFNDRGAGARLIAGIAL